MGSVSLEKPADASGLGKGTKVVTATLGLKALAGASGACPFCSLPSLLLKGCWPPTDRPKLSP